MMTINTTRWIPLALAALALLAASACSSFDHQGMDAEEYYAANPRENRVERATRTHVVHFEAGSLSTSYEEREAFDKFIGDTTPESVETIELASATGDRFAPALRKSVQGMLAKTNLAKSKTSWVQDDSVDSGEVRVSITGLTVIPPNCPDWSQPATRNYSNNWHSAMGCARATNLGRMVADPRDLVRGRSTTGVDAKNSLNAIERYRAGAAGAAAATDVGQGSAAGSSTAGAASTGAAGGTTGGGK